jgi:hypothetical protein
VSDRIEVVYVHVGAPKTGTTFLQGVLAKNRRLLRRRGLLYPGPGADHFLAAQDLVGPFRNTADPRIAGAWGRLLSAIRGGSATAALISHETLMTVTPEQMARITADLPANRVEIVVTARDLARQLPAVWQEDLKHGKSVPFDDFLDQVRSGPPPEGNRRRGFWLWQDLPRVLREWQQFVPANQISVVTVPPTGAPRTLLWSRFADAVRVDSNGVDLEVRRTNTSLAAGEAELLRRLNAELGPGGTNAMAWPDYRRNVKRFLAESVFATREPGPPISIGADDVNWARTVGQTFADTIREGGYRVVGDLDDLIPSATAAPMDRSLASPDDVVDAAVAALGAMTRQLAAGQTTR